MLGMRAMSRCIGRVKLRRILRPAILSSAILLSVLLMGWLLAPAAFEQLQRPIKIGALTESWLAIAIGLIVMMWPILTKIQYETLTVLLPSSRLWINIAFSMIFNWIIGPLVMLGVAWATLPDLPTYRTGVILVGLARCIAMVMVWNQLARGNAEYCAILVVINSVLQIILYAPYSLLFIQTIGGGSQGKIHVSYHDVAISVLIVCYTSFLSPRLLIFYSILGFRSPLVSSPVIQCGISRARNSSPLDSCLGFPHSHFWACSTPYSSCSHTKAITSSVISGQYFGSLYL